MSERTTLRLSDDRKRLLEQAGEIVASDYADDPPRSDIIDAALTHLIQSHQNIDEARGEYEPGTIQDLCNTDVLRLHYRTSIDSEWR